MQHAIMIQSQNAALAFRGPFLSEDEAHQFALAHYGIDSDQWWIVPLQPATATTVIYTQYNELIGQP